MSFNCWNPKIFGNFLRTRSRAFTLVEILIVISIISVIVLFSFRMSTNISKREQFRKLTKEIYNTLVAARFAAMRQNARAVAIIDGVRLERYAFINRIITSSETNNGQTLVRPVYNCKSQKVNDKIMPEFGDEIVYPLFKGANDCAQVTTRDYLNNLQWCSGEIQPAPNTELKCRSPFFVDLNELYITATQNSFSLAQATQLQRGHNGESVLVITFDSRGYFVNPLTNELLEGYICLRSILPGSNGQPNILLINALYINAGGTVRIISNKQQEAAILCAKN